MHGRNNFFNQQPNFLSNPHIAPAPAPTHFYPNTNGIPGGTYNVPGGPQLSGNVIGGSSAGYAYQASATQPLGGNSFLQGSATNVTQNGEHQAQVVFGKSFNLK